MRPALSDGVPPRQLRESVRVVFGPHSAAPAFDPNGDVRDLVVAGHRLVAKRRPTTAAHQERSRAREARTRLEGVTIPGLGPLTVVVPHVVELDDANSVLVSPYLGKSLADEPSTTADILRMPKLSDVFHALLERGVDASGFVPRNLLASLGGLAVIDWEDARFAEGPVRPSRLSLMKWDIAWSDVYQRDPGLRHRFKPTDPADEEDLDEFEQVLSGLLDDGRDVRRVGMLATLSSELHVLGVARPSAATVGHLADDVLDQRLSVFHTMLTAHARVALGDHRYGALLRELWCAVEPHAAGFQHRGSERSGRSEASRAWVRSLCSLADDHLADGPSSARSSLADLAASLSSLDGVPGWAAAGRRAELAEDLLARLACLVTAAIEARGLELILRGSLAQGVLGLGSDIDFELSSPRHPRGHRAAEALLIDLVACFDLDTEGSAARPAEADVVACDPQITRDLHEWMELRRPGAMVHDPGWVGRFLDPDRARLMQEPSEYERSGRQHTAKYLWFETRALVSRLLFRGCPGAPPVALVQQLAELPSLIGADTAEEITDLVIASFHHRERQTTDDNDLEPLRARLDALRARLALPGPTPTGTASHTRR